MRKTLLISLIASLPFVGFTQYYAMDYGFLIGGGQYLGELGGGMEVPDRLSLIWNWVKHDTL